MEGLGASKTKNCEMRIAIPVEDGRLRGRFGGCREFALVEVDANRKEILYTEYIPVPEPRPDPLPSWLRAHGASVIITGKIGKRALGSYANHGIQVCAGVPNTPVEQLVIAYLNGQLTVTPDGCSDDEQRDQPGQDDRGEPFNPGNRIRNV